MTATLQLETIETTEELTRPAPVWRSRRPLVVNREAPRAWRRISLFSPILLLGLWELGSRLELIDSRFFPAPSSIVETGIKLVMSGELTTHVLVTLARIGSGFAIGGAIGMILGLVLGMLPAARAFFTPIFDVLLPIPKVVVYPLLMLICGIGEESKSLIIAIGVFFHLFYNTLSGVLQIPNIYHEVAYANGASAIRRGLSVTIPAAAPNVFTGARLAVGSAFMLSASSEIIGATAGIGYFIVHSWNVFAISKMYVGIVAIALAGYVVASLIRLLEKAVLPWSAK